MGDDKLWHGAIHDHQVGYFASKNGLTTDLAWELILKYGNNRKAVIKAARDLLWQHGRPPACSPVEPPPPLAKSVGRRKR